MLKALTKAVHAGHWKDVEECCDEPVLRRGEQIEQEVSLVAAAPVVKQHLAGHGDGNASTELAGQRVKDECAIVGAAVIGDDEQWAGRKFACQPNDARSAEQPYER